MKRILISIKLIDFFLYFLKLSNYIIICRIILLDFSLFFDI